MPEFDRTSSPFTFSQVPHGLWTCGLSPGATRLLGWLWSHDPDFLRRTVTMRYAQRQLGGRVRDQIAELATAGFLVQTKAEPGKAATIVLDGDAWGALGQPRTSVRTTANDGARSPRTSVRGTANIGAHREEQGEDQGQEQSASDDTSSARTPGQEAKRILDDYWRLVEDETGHKPVAIRPQAFMAVVTPFLTEGYSAAHVKAALLALHRAGRAFTKAAIEAQLHDRGSRPQRRPDAAAAVKGMQFDDAGRLVG